MVEVIIQPNGRFNVLTEPKTIEISFDRVDGLEQPKTMKNHHPGRGHFGGVGVDEKYDKVERKQNMMGAPCLGPMSDYKRLVFFQYYLTPPNDTLKEIDEFVINGEQFFDAFVTHDMNEVYEKGVVCNVTKPADLTHVACLGLRMFRENSEQQQVYKGFREAGATKAEAFIGACTFEGGKKVVVGSTYARHGWCVKPGSSMKTFLSNSYKWRDHRWIDHAYMTYGLGNEAFDSSGVNADNILNKIKDNGQGTKYATVLEAMRKGMFG